jgi:hypothetical protein
MNPRIHRDPKFFTKSGRLTPYALACGYIELDETNGTHTKLWFEGGTVYHVSQHNSRRERVFWDCFERLSAARKRFDAALAR